MKLAFYIASLNRGEDLRLLLQDMVLQTDKYFSIWVIDSQSSDNTIEILDRFSGKLNLSYVSEQDEGIYFALNKAIKNINDDFCICLGSDDRIYNPKFVEEIRSSDLNINSIYYYDIFIRTRGGVRKKVFPPPLKFKKAYGGLAHLHHQSAIIPHWFLQSVKYDTAYKTYADLDLMLKSQNVLTLRKIDVCGVVFSSFGVSSRRFSVLQRYCECINIRRNNGLSVFNIRVLLSFIRAIF